MIFDRILAGFLLSAAIALVAWRVRALTLSGAVAATAVGTVSVMAGWRWAAMLILYFVVGVAFSRVGADAKSRRTSGVLAKGGPRDATQVLANGSVFALCALLMAFVAPARAPMLAAAALGALAASCADTLATEIGTLVGGAPRSVIGWRTVPPGTSGGITVAGTLALAAGSALVAVVARIMGLGEVIAAVALGGIAGAVADSALGALVQERRWCPACERATERAVHDCGSATTHAGGMRWLDNDAVNLLATIVGGAVAAALARA
jgi:uncharacterized protein (TIGR00297 family)